MLCLDIQSTDVYANLHACNMFLSVLGIFLLNLEGQTD